MIPKILLATAYIEQPSTKKNLKFRPFLVKEEKVLLMAKESGVFQDIMIVIKDIVQACCLESNFNVNDITLFDLEYFFIKLRAISISNIERFSSVDNDDNITYYHIINFNEVEVDFPEKVSNKIEVTKDLTLVLKYPTVSIFDEKDLETIFKKEGIHYLILHCIDKVFEHDSLIRLTQEEKAEFLGNLDVKTYNKLKDFLQSTPKIDHKVYWTNSLGIKKFWQFSSIKDFFLFL